MPGPDLGAGYIAEEKKCDRVCIPISGLLLISHLTLDSLLLLPHLKNVCILSCLLIAYHVFVADTMLGTGYPTVNKTDMVPTLSKAF